MKEIILTQGQVALVDDEDYERLNQFKWYAAKGGNTYYAVRSMRHVNGKQVTLKMDHIIVGKPLKGFEVDHRNGNGLNNRRSNLRHATVRQNGQNRKNQNKSSQYPGVSWHKVFKKWQARIRINGKSKFLGYFMNEFEAFNAYKQAVEAIGEKVIEDFNGF